jgi:hypothetical protein
MGDPETWLNSYRVFDRKSGLGRQRKSDQLVLLLIRHWIFKDIIGESSKLEESFASLNRFGKGSRRSDAASLSLCFLQEYALLWPFHHLSHMAPMRWRSKFALLFSSHEDITPHVIGNISASEEL